MTPVPVPPTLVHAAALALAALLAGCPAPMPSFPDNPDAASPQEGEGEGVAEGEGEGPAEGEGEGEGEGPAEGEGEGEGPAEGEGEGEGPAEGEGEGPVPCTSCDSADVLAPSHDIGSTGCNGDGHTVMECVDTGGVCRWESDRSCRNEDPLLANLGCARGTCVPCTASVLFTNGAWEDQRIGQVDYYGDLSVSYGDHLVVHCAGYAWKTSAADGAGGGRRSHTYTRLDGDTGERNVWLARVDCGGHPGASFRARLVCSCRSSQADLAAVAEWAANGTWPDDLTLDEDLGEITCAQ